MSHLKITHLELPDHRQRKPFSRTLLSSLKRNEVVPITLQRSQSTDDSGGSAESESSSQEEANTSPPVANT
ncbi:hypothetical protein KY285_023530 [Solanum tuberosum]|nr:hypothetical protein KY289_023865 [Solanum tuberosum]KAH0675729.1 hypothetical protein KY285_023530 [Solanum tuberosum]